MSRLFVLRFSVILLLIVAITTLFLLMERSNQLRDIKLEQRYRIDRLAFQFNTRLNALVSEFFILKESGEIRAYINQPSEENRQRLEQRFVSFLGIARHYDHVRLINKAGDEEVRVNLINNARQVVSKTDLQNKARRYYFYHTMLLNDDELYVSALDLNIENGQIETPWKPVLRLAVKVFDRQRVLQGVLVANFHASELLASLDMEEPRNHDSLMLLNDRGYWLYGPDESKLWGEDLHTGARFSDEHATEWRLLNSETDSQFYLDDHLISFTTIRFPAGTETALLGKTYNTRQWKLLSRLNERAVFGQFYQQKKQVLWLSPLVMLVVAVVVWLWSRATLQARRHIGQLRQLWRAVEQSEELVYITNRDGYLEYVNPAFQRVTGYSAAEVLGKNPGILKSGKHDSKYYEEMWRKILSGHPFEDVFVNRRKDGHLYYEAKIISPVFDEQGQIVQFVSTGRDVSDMERIVRLRDSLFKLAYNDSLTRLPNRPRVLHQLHQSMSLMVQLNKLMAVMLINVDDFTMINDVYGRKVADSLLQVLAMRLQHSVRKTDIVGRFGGDQFLAIIEYVERVEVVERVAEKIIQEIANPCHLAGVDLQVSCSVGIVFYSFEEESAEDLLKKADQALFQAKRLSKGGYLFYEAGAQFLSSFLPLSE